MLCNYRDYVRFYACHIYVISRYFRVFVFRRFFLYRNVKAFVRQRRQKRHSEYNFSLVRTYLSMISGHLTDTYVLKCYLKWLLTVAIKPHHYSFKIFPRFWLVKSTHIIHHNRLLMTKFGRILRLINR